MFASSAGGGIITSLTSALKILITRQGMPLFFEGFFTSLNYSLSFIAIQLSHFTLATKTPAITATTLARKLNDLSDQKQIDAFVNEAISLHRSAFISVIGNMGLVIPSCIILNFLWLSATGNHLVSGASAIYQLESHNPLTSFTIIYAIITGGILWLSSILGGWIENWCVYRHQYEVMENSISLRLWLGPENLTRLTDFLRKNIAGLSASVTLGFMMGFCHIVGEFFGLPISVRHVTLSTGSITFGVLGSITEPSLSYHLTMAIIGLVFIGVLNFATSFILSLFVASRAKNISLTQFPGLLELIFTEFKKRPRQFYFPNKAN